ncbi:hypothetical protein C1645_828164 [Glomus cerebriforme]|uniref:Uncharacterized protein n=1 Tax=Glomus cerebriforme TaxID=658196 RepID=A0A397SWQ6_9GLOM|nr:hypothetical protein C1645_828164 [Glomus cerebriforme]
MLLPPIVPPVVSATNGVLTTFLGIRKYRMFTVEIKNESEYNISISKKKQIQGRIVDYNMPQKIEPNSSGYMTVKSCRFASSSGVISCKVEKASKNLFLYIGWKTYMRRKPKHFTVVKKRKIRFDKNNLKNNLKLEGISTVTSSWEEKNFTIHVSMSHSRKTPRLKVELKRNPQLIDELKKNPRRATATDSASQIGSLERIELRVVIDTEGPNNIFDA